MRSLLKVLRQQVYGPRRTCWTTNASDEPSPYPLETRRPRPDDVLKITTWLRHPKLRTCLRVPCVELLFSCLPKLKVQAVWALAKVKQMLNIPGLRCRSWVVAGRQDLGTCHSAKKTSGFCPLSGRLLFGGFYVLGCEGRPES